MFCKKCGNELKEDARFCSRCGEGVESEPKTGAGVVEAPTEVEVASVPKESVQEMPVQGAQVVKKNGKKNKKAFFIVLVCMIILGGIVLVWILSKDKDQESKDDDIVGSEQDEEQDGETESDGDMVQQDDSEEMSLVDAKMSQERSEIAFAGDVGNVVSDGIDTYVYVEGFIYQLDNEGKATPLCAVEKKDYVYDYGYYPPSVGLRLYDGVLYYIDNYRVMAYDPAKGYAECLIEENYIYGFYVVGKYIYYIADGCINKYGIEENSIVQKIEFPEDWNGTSSIISRNPHAEDEIIIGDRGSIYDTDPATGVTSNYRTKFTYGYTDLLNVSGSQSYELDWSSLDTFNITTKNYIYPYHIVTNTKGYEEERVYKVPSVIVEDDFLNMLEIIEETWPQEASLIKEYYRKYDINNWRERDEEIRDEMLERYPVLEEKIIYVLHPSAKNNVKNLFEEVFENAGIADDLMEKAAELDKNPPDESSEKDLFRLMCINPETLQVEYCIEQPLFIRSVLGYYENDLIVYAYINDVAGIYRISERSLWECGLNGQPLQPELIMAVETDLRNMGKYTINVYPTDEYLYYTMLSEHESLYNLSKLYRIKWDKGILPEGPAEGEAVVDLYANGGLEEAVSKYASVWVDGVEFRVLGYPDNESQLVKVAADEYVVQMVLPRSVDFTQYKLTAWDRYIQDGQEKVSYYFWGSDTEEFCISFISGTGVQETFEASYETVKEEESVADLQTVNGKGYTVQSSMAIPDSMYSVGMPMQCCTAMIYDSTLQVICSVTLLNEEGTARQQFEDRAGEIVFGEFSDKNMIYRTSIVGEDYDKRMANMYAKYKEIVKDTDTYMTEICENPGMEFDYHYIYDLTRDGVPEIIYMGNPHWICIVGEKNAINLPGSTVVLDSEPGIIYVPVYGTDSSVWTKYKVTVDEQGYLVSEVVDAEYLTKKQGVYTYRGYVIDEQEFIDTQEQLFEKCYMPDAILYYWGLSASEGQFYNSVKRLAPMVEE